jgi:hypothetical protein
MVRTLLLGVIALTLTAPIPQKTAPPKKPTVNADAAVIADFVKHVDGYAALHKKLEATLPALPKQTTPQQMDAHERALAKLIQDGRASAKQGDLFTPAMQRLVRRLLAPVFTGRAGAQIKSEITDKEYKGTVKLAVNGRYPDEVPVSTMPPQVLQALPKLPEELEYRFVLTSLILFDPHAHIIPDFVEQAFK